MDTLVSRALMIWLSLHPSPASETSAFNNIRAFSSRCAGLFPFRISASSCSRSSALNRTTYRFTEISFAAMIPSAVNSDDKSESPNPFEMVEAGEMHEFRELLVGAMAWGGLLVLIMGLAGAAVIGAGSVRRINEVARTIERIVDSNLAERLPTSGTASDLDRLVDVVNGML